MFSAPLSRTSQSGTSCLNVISPSRLLRTTMSVASIASLKTPIAFVMVAPSTAATCCATLDLCIRTSLAVASK